MCSDYTQVLVVGFFELSKLWEIYYINNNEKSNQRKTCIINL